MLSFTMPNGIRVIHIPSKSLVAHCALYIKAGSRDELESEQGMAHFVEHMLFKGTKNRKPYHILSRLDSVGGEINAFTSKEETCIYASFLAPYYGRAINLIFDIAFCSTFPEKELEREKAVILEEIESYKDSPSEQIFDDFEDLIFAGHPIGRNILGTPKSLENFKREHIIDFTQRTYLPQEMVFISTGPIKESNFRKLVEKNVPTGNVELNNNKRKTPTSYSPGKLILQQQTHQTHMITGNRSYSMTDENNLGFSLLNNLLGGPGLNNRLNLNIREKYGFTYHVESFYNAYSDTGIFGVYLGTDYRHIDKSMRLIHKELGKLREQKLGSLQLHRAKKQYIGQMLLQQDNQLNHLLGLGKVMLYQEAPEKFKEIEKRLDALNASELMEMANNIFDIEQMSTIIYASE
ncbi:MAG: insulinase family protein [Flavobacteriales bacterium]|nr:MAG: insulinase family protein [Flavobacteriales bacterium]